MRVEIYRDNGSGFSYTKSAYTDSTGAYLAAGLPPGTYAVRTDDYSTYVNEVYDDVACCDLSAGTPITVALNAAVTGIDFDLDRWGEISGTVTDAVTGDPIYGVEVGIRTPTGGWGDWASDENSYSGFVDELYDDLPCEPSCDPTAGAPVTVVLGQETSGIDFVLGRFASVTGSVFDEDTGNPLSGIEVQVWGADGSHLDYRYTDSSGTYTFQGLPPGTCYVGTSYASDGGYLDELYSDVPCYQGYGCDPTKGSPVPTVIDTTTENVHFALRTSGSAPRGPGGLQGTVEDAVLGSALLGVLLDVWDDTGSRVATVVADSAGRYDVSLAAGTYFVSTDNRRGFVDEVFGGVLCSGAPASGGGCDPTLGAPVTVASGMVTGIDFALAGKWEIFTDGFESGNVSAWSSVVGSP